MRLGRAGEMQLSTRSRSHGTDYGRSGSRRLFNRRRGCNWCCDAGSEDLWHVQVVRGGVRNIELSSAYCNLCERGGDYPGSGEGRTRTLDQPTLCSLHHSKHPVESIDRTDVVPSKSHQASSQTNPVLLAYVFGLTIPGYRNSPARGRGYMTIDAAMVRSRTCCATMREWHLRGSLAGGSWGARAVLGE